VCPSATVVSAAQFLGYGKSRFLSLTAASNDNTYGESCHSNQSKQDHSMPNQSTLAPHNCTACGHDQDDLNILNPRLIRHPEGRKIHMRNVNQCFEFK